MEWNAKTPSLWDWENLALFCGNSRQEQQAEWEVEGVGRIDNGSIYSSGGGAFSASELGNGTSSKSSISASIDSSYKAGIKLSEFNFEATEEFPKNLNKNKDPTRLRDTGTSPLVAAATAGSRESLIGLKLGKRTYFEDACAGIKNPSLSASMMPSTALVKKPRASHQSMQSFCCQVEGCNVNLTAAKDYHRKHRVCESHSKCPKVIVAGQELRFCQQCSRFHDLSEFDQKKRSCRRRLFDHNARRRKPQPDTTSFNSARLFSSFYDDRQQMNLLLNRAPFGHMRPAASSTWEGSFDFKITQMKGSWKKPTKVGGINELLHLPSTEPSNVVSTVRLLPFKGTTAEVLTQGPEASAIASNLVDRAPDLRRALSLLSTTDSWGSTDPRLPSFLFQPLHSNETSGSQHVMHAVSPPLEYSLGQQLLAEQELLLPFSMHSNGSQFQEIQLFKSPYETAFFDSNQIH